MLPDTLIHLWTCHTLLQHRRAYWSFDSKQKYGSHVPSPNTMSRAEAVSLSTGVLATHVYTPWSLWLTLTIWRTPSSMKYLLPERCGHNLTDKTVRYNYSFQLRFNLQFRKKNKKKTILLPWILSVVEGILHIIFFPKELKVIAEGLVVLCETWEPGRGSN